MNLTKKQMMIAAIVIGAVAVWYFLIRKKKMESSYDEDLLIFGNENGYTNYELDGGSLESAYGPEYGAYGSYGTESGYGPNYGAYGSYGYETGYKAGGKYDIKTSRRNTSDSAYDGSNVGQMCKKDRHCTPGLVCDKGRCADKRKGQTVGIKPPPRPGIAMPVADVKPAPYYDKVALSTRGEFFV